MASNLKSFMTISKSAKLIVTIIVTAALAGCSQSEDQRNFEERALLPPSGIMAMNANGAPADGGEEDPDDWQIAPEFQGTIDVQTAAFPNPVSFNSTFEILIEIQSFQSVSGLQVFAFQQPNNLIGPLFQQTGELNPGFNTIQLSPRQFASEAGTGNLGSLYRIIIYSSRQEVITYGDVQIE
jgi:hypothetical protein